MINKQPILGWKKDCNDNNSLVNMRKIFGSRFFISSYSTFDGDISKVLNKAVEPKAKDQAKWINDHVKELLPKIVVKYVLKFRLNWIMFFSGFLIRNVFNIEICTIRDIKGNTIVIKKHGKKMFSKYFI